MLLLVLTSVTVLTLDFRGSGIVDDLRGGASTLFGPLRDAGAWVGRPVADSWNGVFGYNELENENEELRARLDQLEGERLQAEAALRDMDEIAELDDLRRWTDLPTVTARVVGGPISNFEHTLEIDKGTNSGLAEGMPVVTGAGLVGRVVQANSTRSIVELITDPAVEFGIRLNRSGEIGIAHGTGEDEPLVVDEGIAVNVDVNDNEGITTSGLERSIFPPDVPVGRVVELAERPDQLSQILTIEPAADLRNLAYVRVLQWTPS